MSKWAILRKAILSKAGEAEDGEAAEASIHRHDGFHLFAKSRGAPPPAVVEFTSFGASPREGFSELVARIDLAFVEHGADSVTVRQLVPKGATRSAKEARDYLAKHAGPVFGGVFKVGAEASYDHGGGGPESTRSASHSTSGSNGGSGSAAVLELSIARPDELTSTVFEAREKKTGFEVVRYTLPHPSDPGPPRTPGLRAGGVGSGVGAGGAAGSPSGPSLAGPSLTSLAVRVLERRPGAKLALSELKPHDGGHGEGVDNTGNVRVWPAEQVPS